MKTYFAGVASGAVAMFLLPHWILVVCLLAGASVVGAVAINTVRSLPAAKRRRLQ